MDAALIIYAGFLTFYHSSEFLLAYLYNRSEFGFDSLLFSKPYLLAHSCAIVEYFVERYFFGPDMKSIPFILIIGTVMALVGEVLRKLAMIQGQHNFTHQIQTHRRQNHKLVTHGVYKYFRHPGYFGWFVFAVGTQVLLANPISVIGFTFSSWNFFNDRIEYEEELLMENSFFGKEYKEYRARTPTWIPFIK